MQNMNLTASDVQKMSLQIPDMLSVMKKIHAQDEIERLE